MTATQERVTAWHAARTADWLEDLEWLMSQGVCVAGITESLGQSVSAICRRLERHGRRDLATHFWRYVR